mmetsp:Transcript_14767/g.12589  ORF Transcript_14767/g.12589 Transcript_14767/m.12589 type:complete len:113 (-) Transcript_14767:257-595(-)
MKNQDMGDIVLELPQYKAMTKNHVVYLYQENRINITLSDQCHTSIGEKELKEFSNLELDAMKNLTLFLFIALIFIGIFSFFNKIAGKFLLFGYTIFSFIGFYLCFDEENKVL